jgi:hypothetical protein
MLEMEKLLSAICNKLPEGLTFEPSDTDLTDYFPATAKGDEEEITSIDVKEPEKRKPVLITPKYPIESQVIAIDSTNFTLGQIPDGLVGAIRGLDFARSILRVFQSVANSDNWNSSDNIWTGNHQP